MIKAFKPITGHRHGRFSRTGTQGIPRGQLEITCRTGMMATVIKVMGKVTGVTAQPARTFPLDQIDQKGMRMLSHIRMTPLVSSFMKELS